MSSKRSKTRTWLALGGLLSACSLPRAALAHHTATQRVTDDTADTLEPGKLRAGPFKLEYTLFEGLTFGTYPLPWLLKAANLHTKWRYYAGKQVSLSARLGYVHFDTESLQKLDEQKTHASIIVLPFDVAGTWRVGKRLSMSVDLAWTGVFIDGESDQQTLKGAFQGGTSNLQTLYTLELRLGKVTALLLQPRFLSYQLLNLKGDLVVHPDEFTTVEIHGAQQSDVLDFRGAYSLTLSALFSWETFNLRLGVGYGNYNIPGINFMLPQRSLFPDLDLYWIF